MWKFKLHLMKYFKLELQTFYQKYAFTAQYKTQILYFIFNFYFHMLTIYYLIQIFKKIYT